MTTGRRELDKAVAALKARKAQNMADAKDFLEKLSPEEKVVWAALQVARKKLDAAVRDLGRGSSLTGVVRCREAQDVLNRAKEAWAAVKAVTP